MIKYKSYSFVTGERKEIKEINKGGVSNLVPTASVCLEVGEKRTEGVALGENSLDALFKAFCDALGKEVKNEIHLKRYNIYGSFQANNPRKRLRDGNPMSSASVVVGIDKKEGIGLERNKESGKAFLLALIEATNQAMKGGE